jgi:hypothetical protein
MKKILFNLFVFLVAISLAFGLHLKHSANVKAASSKNGGEDIDGYLKWEQQRLADPATGMIPYNIRNLELNFAATLPNDLQDKRRKQDEGSGLWQMRGPWNIGGRTRAFAPDVTNEATLLAGTAAGGMWRSTDSGKTWTLTTPLAQEQSVSCLAQDTRTGYSNIWYYGSGECYGASASATGAYYLGNGLYRSIDDGQTWSVLASTSFNSFTFSSLWQAIWSVATDPSRTDSSVVYVSTIGEVNRSTDSGRTWKTVLGGNTSDYSYYTNVIVTPEGVVYVTMSTDGPQFGIWRSVDGLNFTNITPPGFPASYSRIVMCYAPTDHNQLYFLANTSGYGTPDTNFLGQVEWNSLWKYKYLSGDGDTTGGAWFNLSANLPHSGGLFDKYNCQESYDMVVSYLPNDTSTVFIGGTDIFRSTTGFFDDTHTAHIGGYAIGASLPNIQVYPGDHPDQHVLFFSQSNPYILYSGCDGGLFKTMNDTADNVTWKTFDSGYITSMMYTITSNHAVSGSPILVAGLQDNDCLFDNSTSLTNHWTKPIFGDGSFCDIADSGKLFYYETTTGHLFKTQMDTTNGTVVAFNRIDPIGGKDYEWLNPYVIDPNNNNLMYFGGGKYLWRNNNLSAIPLSNMWDSISTNWIQWPDSIPITGADITAIAVSTNPANTVYYGTSDKEVYKINNANSGTPTVSDISSNSGYNGFPYGAFVTCIAVDPDSADRVIVAYSNYDTKNLFYTADGGTSWARIGGNLNGANQPSLRWAAIQHPKSGGTIYWIAASTGLYATDTLRDSATIWVQQATNTIGNSVCDMVDVRQSDGLVSVATHTRGAYTANITSISDITTVHNLNPPVADLQVEIYPNPSSGKAFIHYYLPNEENVQLKIYSEGGVLVKQMAINDSKPGNNILPIDISRQAAGIYFCSLATSDKVKTIRMLVVK